MARLSKQDKKDLSAQVKGEFFQAAKKKKIAFDDFIEFLTVINVFANHKRRPFRPMGGDNFRI